MHCRYVATQGQCLGRDGRVHVRYGDDGTILLGDFSVTCIKENNCFVIADSVHAPSLKALCRVIDTFIVNGRASDYSKVTISFVAWATSESPKVDPITWSWHASLPHQLAFGSRTDVPRARRTSCRRVAEGTARGPSLQGRAAPRKDQDSQGRRWVDLGKPTPDPIWGFGRGRAWTPTMPTAPDLAGAFLYGEGIHGYVKPDGHYMDDLWFYDVNAHAWICAWPGTDVKDVGNFKLNADGFVVTPNGQCPPIATLVHGYNMPCYSPDLKKSRRHPRHLVPVQRDHGNDQTSAARKGSKG